MANSFYHNLADKELVGRCIKRDHLAWKHFVERYSKLVFWAIKERLSSRGCYCSQEDLADVFQDVFANIWINNKLRQVKNRERIKTWLIMVAGNLAIDHVKKHDMRQAADTVSIYQSISERMPEEGQELTFEETLAGEDTPRTQAQAAEIKESVESEALVMPNNTSINLPGRFPSASKRSFSR